jgi:hypothetical protein
MPINPIEPIASIPEPKPLMSDEGTARISLAIFPNGVKPGDRVSLTITGVDSITGTATVVADEPTNAVAAAPEKKDVIDTKLSMGPMDDLKSYLYSKTMEKEA